MRPARKFAKVRSCYRNSAVAASDVIKDRAATGEADHMRTSLRAASREHKHQHIRAPLGTPPAGSAVVLQVWLMEGLLISDLVYIRTIITQRLRAGNTLRRSSHSDVKVGHMSF